MQRYAALLRPLGDVVLFDYPYMTRGSRSPDPLPKLVSHHREVVERAARNTGSVVLVGKSMGGRIGCHVAVEDPSRVAACVCLGYPLVGAARGGRPGKVRDQVLVDLRTPVLFVQGTRDPLCPLDALRDVRARMTAPNALFIVDSGDHSLEATKAHLKSEDTTQDDVDAAVVRAIAEFLQAQLA
jgi:predicted alpha/beta-hydrolase family hydrolase